MSLMQGGKMRIAEGQNNEIQLLFYCPGCGMPHGVRTRGEGPRWSWNGSPAAPTFKPSILVDGGKHGDRDRFPSGTLRCHSFVTDGQIRFLSDCTHKMAGQTVAMPLFRYSPGDDSEVSENA